MVTNDKLKVLFQIFKYLNGFCLFDRTFRTYIESIIMCAVRGFNMRSWHLHRVPEDYFMQLAIESASSSFRGDLASCFICATANHFKEGEWFLMRLPDPSDISITRAVRVLCHRGIDKDTIYVKEDVFYNICQIFNINNKTDVLKVILESTPPKQIEEFKFATVIKIAAIHTSVELLPDDEHLLLNEYFSKPRYMHLNDIFNISLETYAKHLKRSALYHQLDNVFYKVIGMEPMPNDDSGSYVVKGHTTLICTSPIASYIPPSKSKVPSRRGTKNNAMLTLSPPDLTNYVNQMTSLIDPFLTSRSHNVEPMFLLTGPSGSGKMVAIKTVCKIFGLHLLVVDCYEFFGVGVSAVEAKYDFVFTKAEHMGPCVLVFTRFELIGKDKSNKEDARLVSSFLRRSTASFEKAIEFPLIVLGVTNCKPDELVPYIARAFVQTIKFHAPHSQDILPALSWMIRDAGFVMDDFALISIMRKLSGFVHDDLALLVRHALRLFCEDQALDLDVAHFERAIDIMEAAYADAIGAAKVPNVQWDDVGGLSAIKEEVSLTLNLPLQRPDLLGSNLRRTGILFYGPPGTGKTLLAKAVATECAMNFISVKGPELMNMYVGQSERNVREVFERGREAAPCIVFFDELDSLAPNRGKSGDSGGVTDRVVSQLLAEMDGLQSNRGLFIIAATNRPDLIDPALLRPGRFDKMFYLGPCSDNSSKLSVLKALTKRFNLSSDVNLNHIVDLLPAQITGADVYSVCSNAWLSAARRSIALTQNGVPAEIPLKVTLADFEEGLTCMVPSLTANDLKYYEHLSASTVDKKLSNVI